jgi:hypothetical protein
MSTWELFSHHLWRKTVSHGFRSKTASNSINSLEMARPLIQFRVTARVTVAVCSIIAFVFADDLAAQAIASRHRCYRPKVQYFIRSIS